MTTPPHVCITGAGPAGLMAAETLAAGGARVRVFDRMPSVGRKLLMAGRGGLNLTHSEPLDAFLGRYAEAQAWLEPAVRNFPPEALRAWADNLGQDTFVGSSRRVFPRAMKASPMLRAWLARLADVGVEIETGRRWTGWTDAGALTFATGEAVACDAVILAMGGASWPRLGSDGRWAPVLADQGVAVAPFLPSNAGVEIAWSAPMRERFTGAAVKPVALTHARRRVRGEATVTAYGLEGGAIYALSASLRDAIAAEGSTRLWLDLSPDVDEATLATRIARAPASATLSNRLRKARLSPVAIGLMREAAGAALPTDPRALSKLAKGAALTLTAMRGLDGAISSAGGVTRTAVDDRLMLTARPGVFVAGEMLDWEAPTGGYLLQAAFATGRAAGLGALDWLSTRTAP